MVGVLNQYCSSKSALRKPKMDFIAIFLLCLLSVLGSVLAKNQNKNISGFECYLDGVCFKPGYERRIAPKNEFFVTLYPPKRTILRKVDVFESTISLDMFKAKMEWSDQRLRMASKRTKWVDEKYGDFIWVPQIVNRNMKSVTHTQFKTTPPRGEIIQFF